MTDTEKTATEHKQLSTNDFVDSMLGQQTKNGIIKCVDQIKSFFFSRFMKFVVQNVIKDLKHNEP